MTDKRAPTLDELKAQHGPAFEDMAIGLFRPHKHQVFEARELSAELIADFCQSEEVFGASLEYANRLKAIWAARYPDHAPLKSIPAPRVEPLILPVFEQPAAAPLKPGQIPAAGAAAPATQPDMKTHFNLPNCRVGVPYSAAITGADAASAKLIVTQLQIPADLGLAFDPDTQLVAGQPARDGEFELALHWRYPDSTAQSSGMCHLIVNPDPRSLWKVVEPAAGQPYAKPHLDQQLIAGDGVRLLAASRRGRSHEHGGAFRDDDFFLDHDATSGWSVMLVADGAGSARHSREGARLAVETAGEHIAAQLKGAFGARVLPLIESWDDAASQEVGNEFHYVFHSAAMAAVQAIEAAALAADAQYREFATTLLAVATRREGAHTFVAVLGALQNTVK